MSRVLKPGAKVFIDIQNHHKWTAEAFANLNHTFAIVEEVKLVSTDRWYRDHENDKVLVAFSSPKQVNNISVCSKFHFDIDDVVVMP